MIVYTQGSTNGRSPPSEGAKYRFDSDPLNHKRKIDFQNEIDRKDCI